ncbi:protein kinase domain-containing protein [Iningainema tapete]|uniref:Serine/threonine protein kinase n=1 Tax=Iningainema tapete BLCC-T55 TaxID=2748662 RepID=A0A8J7CAN1_9CYAN|nr:serine/threonine protein kinase [Iningainema tapete BLCC-T55]
MNKNAFASSTGTGLIANRYQLKQLIGRGGMGEVFLANDLLLGEVPVAIKFLSQTVTDIIIKQDFAREARICAALSQKSLHIVRVTDYGVSPEGKPFYTMEYLLGKSLKDLIPLPLPQFLALCRQICLGLQCAHQGMNIDDKVYPLVHRDIKPANVLVIPDPILGQLVKILDFGIARFLNYSAMNAFTNKGFQGTLPYCSPEQLEGTELDSRSDIYSLGVMMFEMLTGEKPWQPETNMFGAWYKAHQFETPRSLSHVNPNLRLPKKLDHLIMACLAKSPSSRPQTLAEVLKVLESVESAVSSHYSPPLTNSQTHKLTNSPSLELCGKLVWPKDKPIQEIVFPHLLHTQQGSVAALSLMMPQQQIKGYAVSTPYNQFSFVSSPYPMLLWVTVLHTSTGTKWLKSYLDMQNPQNHILVSSLVENERYPLIFFSLEAPHSCTNIIGSVIHPSDRLKLKTWVEQSKRLPPCQGFQLSKKLLQEQYQLLQPRILSHLTSTPKAVA